MTNSRLPEILRVYLPRGTNQALDVLAQRNGMDRSAWVRHNLVLPAVKADRAPAPEKAA
jgi:hypothetical protein